MDTDHRIIKPLELDMQRLDVRINLQTKEHRQNLLLTTSIILYDATF